MKMEGNPKSEVRKRAWSAKRVGEALAIVLMLGGVAMVCQPFWHVLFRWGFLVTLVGIGVFTVASNLPARGGPDE